MDLDQLAADYRWARGALQALVIRALLGISVDFAGQAKLKAAQALMRCRP
jgi:hypothetical protein